MKLIHVSIEVMNTKYKICKFISLNNPNIMYGIYILMSNINEGIKTIYNIGKEKKKKPMKLLYLNGQAKKSINVNLLYKEPKFSRYTINSNYHNYLAQNVLGIKNKINAKVELVNG